MTYTHKMTVKNPKSGEIETYFTSLDTREQRDMARAFWRGDAGYEVISFEALRKEYDFDSEESG